MPGLRSPLSSGKSTSEEQSRKLGLREGPFVSTHFSGDEELQVYSAATKLRLD